MIFMTLEYQPVDFMKALSFDKRVDDYVLRSAEFAKPVLEHLRQIIHEACPDVEETMKWSFPHFMYQDAILCSMAAFKQHCAFGFWLGAMMKDTDGLLEVGEKTSMGHLGQIRSLKDVPSKKVMTKYVKEAMKLIENGETKKRSPVKTTKVTEVKVPDYFISALKKNKKAFNTFQKFSNSHRKEYVQWIVEAKTKATRDKRIQTATEWLAEGKPRNWKYMK
jgi:uncharacterized protein YdeI (YjbR/CyaY-like superfamily)